MFNSFHLKNVRHPEISATVWEDDLRSALDNDEFRVFFQPIIELPGGSTTGFEALIRWEHPKYGFISPGEFLATAERTGLIGPIGDWVLSTACRQVMQWQEELKLPVGLTIGVNLSAAQFRHPGLVNAVEHVLADTGLQAKYLMVEVSERDLMADTRFATGVLRRLRAIGVRFAMDDFGLGYSSLGALNKFPLDFLKLDRPFVREIAMNKDSLRIASTIVALTSRLGIETIAEGVEERDQAGLLSRIKCRYAQGYYYSSPLNPQEARTWLTNRNTSLPGPAIVHGHDLRAERF